MQLGHSTCSGRVGLCLQCGLATSARGAMLGCRVSGERWKAKNEPAATRREMGLGTVLFLPPRSSFRTAATVRLCVAEGVAAG